MFFFYLQSFYYCATSTLTKCEIQMRVFLQSVNIQIWCDLLQTMRVAFFPQMLFNLIGSEFILHTWYNSLKVGQEERTGERPPIDVKNVPSAV